MVRRDGKFLKRNQFIRRPKRTGGLRRSKNADYAAPLISGGKTYEIMNFGLSIRQGIFVSFFLLGFYAAVIFVVSRALGVKAVWFLLIPLLILGIAIGLILWFNRQVLISKGVECKDEDEQDSNANFPLDDLSVLPENIQKIDSTLAYVHKKPQNKSTSDSLFILEAEEVQHLNSLQASIFDSEKEAGEKTTTAIGLKADAELPPLQTTEQAISPVSPLSLTQTASFSPAPPVQATSSPSQSEPSPISQPTSTDPTPQESTVQYIQAGSRPLPELQQAV
ncbi:MAG: hypothetical protein KME07_02050, partial [Pegethrix bostrychoides GSE-TBD4-15B]|nr:hypothetical protein [Pegethrix bostrychoides GSE-TBD4-15B]